MTTTNPTRSPGPAWQIAELFPEQGELSEKDYLYATRETNKLAEFSDGYLEVLPMPTIPHQRIVQFLSNLLLHFAAAGNLGEVLFAPLRVRLRPGKFREPDIVFMLAQNTHRAGDEFWHGADLVMEVTSEDDESRRRDLVTKRAEYAEAEIPEYWIVDPQQQTITVLTLPVGAKVYAVHGVYRPGDVATSPLLGGFAADVTAVFEAAKR